MTGLKSFGVVQEPDVVGHGAPAGDYKNITDRPADGGQAVVRFALRVGPGGKWYDGDGSGAGKDATRQRAECRALGGDATQGSGETWEYGTTLRTDPKFRVWNGGWNAVMQLKPPGAGSELPLVFVNVVDSKGADLTAEIVYNPRRDPAKVLRRFTFRAGEWVRVQYRVKVHPAHGFLEASVNGDAWKGVRDCPMAREGVPEWDAKFGLYRKYWGGEMEGEVYVEHKAAYRKKL